MKTRSPLMPIYGTRLPKDFRVEFVRHQSARKIVLAFFRYDHPRMSVDRLMGMETDFHVFLGKRWVRPARVFELIRCVRSVGVWGYCNHRSRRVKEIHYWIGRGATRINVMEFFLHEMAHAGGFRTEEIACKIAGLGAFIYGVLESDFAWIMGGETQYNTPYGANKNGGRFCRGGRSQAGGRDCGKERGARDQVRHSY